jgi:hypothetical protein
VELFDLCTDIGEEHNLTPSDPDRVRGMRRGAARSKRRCLRTTRTTKRRRIERRRGALLLASDAGAYHERRIRGGEPKGYCAGSNLHNILASAWEVGPMTNEIAACSVGWGSVGARGPVRLRDGAHRRAASRRKDGTCQRCGGSAVRWLRAQHEGLADKVRRAPAAGSVPPELRRRLLPACTMLSGVDYGVVACRRSRTPVRRGFGRVGVAAPHGCRRHAGVTRRSAATRVDAGDSLWNAGRGDYT